MPKRTLQGVVVSDKQAKTVVVRVENGFALAVVPANRDVDLEALRRQIGAVIPRQNMKDKSGATVMDPRTQVTSVASSSGK